LDPFDANTLANACTSGPDPLAEPDFIHQLEGGFTTRSWAATPSQSADRTPSNDEPTRTRMMDAELARRDATEVVREEGLYWGDGAIIRATHAVLVDFPRAGLVVRVEPLARWPSTRQQVLVSKHLERAGVPAIESAFPKPVKTDHHAISVWKRLTLLDQPASYEHLGQLARQLHTTSAALPAGITALDPLAEIEAQLPRALDGPGDIDDLWAELPLLRDAWYRAQALDPLGIVLLHGDLNRDNVAMTPNGPVLMDLEMSALGPATWDLVAQEIAVRRYGAQKHDYQVFLDTYGSPTPMAWDGAEVLCRLYELMVTAWALHNRAHSPLFRREASVRLACVRGQSAERWTLL
jgi:hypothetical protein